MATTMNRRPSSRRELVADVAHRIQRLQASHPRRVAIDGPDMAGKSTLADELAAVLSGEAAYRREAPILAKHGYFPITQSQSSGSFSAGHILAFGIAGLAARSGGLMTVTYRREA
jgi:hypothetical protein